MTEPRPGPTTAARAGEQWDALARLYDDALALPVDERDAYLRECAADTTIVRQVRELLAAQTGGTVDRAIAAIAGAGRSVVAAPTPPSRVGAYEVLREIGRGGMGVVYLARRADGTYQRLVALKVSNHPVAASSLAARFLAERDILAGLAHPNIVPLFDAGVTDEGLPYFTMEFVDGVPIDTYCDRHALDLKARIRLFLRICSAVAAAHRALVVHRDLKPTNVLVTDGGDVKLLDFGIAKLLEQDLAPPTDTATDGRLMTPAYASPEQIRGVPVSTATDVYALGLLLYELLVGRRAHRFTSDGLAELVRVIAECDPPALSAAVTRPGRGDGVAAEVLARRRRTSASRLARQLRGDLERIVSKALAKAPERRYASAAHLAEDLQRFLDGQPVEARGASTDHDHSAARHSVVDRFQASSPVGLDDGYVLTTIATAPSFRRAHILKAPSLAPPFVARCWQVHPHLNGPPVRALSTRPRDGGRERGRQRDPALRCFAATVHA
jgi:serine/threonine-protein kinase